MNKGKELVLFYTPQVTERTSKLKGIFVRLGIRIKNITADQMKEKVGYLAGMDGFGPCPQEEEPETGVPDREMLVMKNFTSPRIDELLLAIRKAGLAKIELKAVVTPTNADWPLYRLYQEIEKEHEEMTKGK